MNIHEYQAKEIFRRYGVPVADGGVASTPKEAESIARSLTTDVIAVKSQIHAGGRGKAGGIKMVKTPEEAAKATRELIGKVLVTHQTGPLGKQVRKVLIEAGSIPKREFYLSILIDRSLARPSFLASTEGGVDIEAVAAKSPEKILKEPVDPAIGAQPYQARKIAYALGLGGPHLQATVNLILNVYRAFIETDASLIEINPLIVDQRDRVFALDAKMNFDDNALYRHKDIQAMRDLNEEDPREVEASRFGLNYIGLDGTIACMVNGAGLAMATMDIIKFAGGNPANFLDVGGSASQEQIEHAFDILLSDANVKAIFINIFGGILRVDRLAAGVVAAARNLKISVPIVLRLEGTNVEEGRKILKTSGLNFLVGETMKEAADLVVKAVSVGA